MQKRLYLLFALILTSVFIVSCNEKSAEKMADPKVVAAVTEKAGKVADNLDNMVLKAYEMGQVGSAMAKAGESGAAQVLDQALSIARDTHSDANKAFLAQLKQDTADWTGKDAEGIAPIIDRIQNATTRVWVIRSIAEGLDAGKAKGVLADAAAEATAIPDKRYRDMDLMGVSGALAALDPQAAMDVAGKIDDQRVKAYALEAIGTPAALDAAVEAALAIQKMEPESPTLTRDAHEDIRARVLAAEKDKLVAASAKALASIAVAMDATDASKAKSVLAQAAQAASSIEHPYTKNYAISDVAIAMADVDPQGAAQLADAIPDEHADAKYAALMKVAEVNSGKGTVDEAGLEKAADAAKMISGNFDREKALTKVALAMVACNKDKAAELANEIKFGDMKDEVLAALAVAASKEGDTAAKTAMDKIVEPRFAKNRVALAEATALCDMADLKMASDPEAAKKLYSKAAGMASEAKSVSLQWRCAKGLCKIDPDKLYDMASKIEGDEASKALALADIAADWSARGEAQAGVAWDMAIKAAAGIDDSPKSCELLKAIAAKCAQHDKARASAVFTKAVEKANKIGAVAG